MNFSKMISLSNKVDKLAKELQETKDELNFLLMDLYADAKQYGYSLWHTEQNTYFWENNHRQIAKYDTLSEAVKAYAEERISFGE